MKTAMNSHAKELATKLTLELRAIMGIDDYHVLAIGGIEAGDPAGYGIYHRDGGTHLVSIRLGVYSASAELMRVIFTHWRAEKHTPAPNSHR